MTRNSKRFTNFYSVKETQKYILGAAKTTSDAEKYTALETCEFAREQPSEAHSTNGQLSF